MYVCNNVRERFLFVCVLLCVYVSLCFVGCACVCLYLCVAVTVYSCLVSLHVTMWWALLRREDYHGVRWPWVCDDTALDLLCCLLFVFLFACECRFLCWLSLYKLFAVCGSSSAVMCVLEVRTCVLQYYFSVPFCKT